MNQSIAIGRIEIGVVADDPAIEAIVHERYDAFVVPAGQPVCTVRIEPNGIARGQPNPPFADLRGAGSDHIDIDHVDFTASIDVDGEAVLRTATDPFTIDHFFRLLMGALAPRHGALMLHSCGILVGAEAHVFAGESGAGKSTLASLAGDRPVLSDEHVLVRPLDGRWMAASTPFWGAYALPSASREAPLATLWSLRQSPAHEARPVDQAAALRIALENAVLPSSELGIKQAVFEVAGDLAAAVPAAELHFTPDASVWEEVSGARAVA